MCGIAGILSAGSVANADHLTQKFLSSLHHRGPNSAGAAWISQDGSVNARDRFPSAARPSGILVHTRLAILDLTAAANQPFSDPSARYWIVYNGEVYNYVEIRADLQKKAGVSFRTNSDTEVVLAAYMVWGEACLHRFNGMFAFAIWDCVEKTLFCCRDRFGVKPFLYALPGSQFAFASEASALFQSGTLQREFQTEPLLEYLCHGRVNYGAETFWRGVHRLEAGTCGLYRNGEFRTRRWYTLSLPVEYRACDTEQLQFLLEDSVRLRMRSDVPVASCLSGGIDSSSIVAIMSALSGEPVRTYTAITNSQIVDGVNVGLDHHLARQMSDRCGTDHHEINIAHIVSVEELARFVAHHGLPVRSSGAFNQYALMREIKRQGSRVVLDGQGGDELFLGYFHHFGWVLSHLRQHNKKEFAKLCLGMTAHRSFGLRNLLIHVFPGITFPHRQRYNRRHLDNILVDPANTPDYRNLLAELSPPDFRRKRYNEICVHQLPWLLCDEDLNSMHFGVEARLPFLDYRLVEFAFQLHPASLLEHGYSKYQLRKASLKWIPETIALNRNKCGFYFDCTDRMERMDDYTLDGVRHSSALSSIVKADSVEKAMRNESLPKHFKWRLFCLSVLAKGKSE